MHVYSTQPYSLYLIFRRNFNCMCLHPIKTKPRDNLGFGDFKDALTSRSHGQRIYPKVMCHQSNHSCTWATVTTCREIWNPAEMAQISQWHTWLRWLIYYNLVHFPPIWRGPLCLPSVWSLEFCWLPVCLSIPHSPPGLSFVFNPIMPRVEISWPQQEVTRPAVSGTHLLISQPPHWPTQQDGCFAHM